jgi:DNA-binding transcriptional ArsR family regulator
VSAASDVAIVAFPAFTALAGAFFGARFETSTQKERELRELLDAATRKLPDVRLKLGECRSDLEREGPAASEYRRGRLEALDDARVDAEKLADLIATRAGCDEPACMAFNRALAARTGMTPNAVSQQLRVLRHLRMVIARREGRTARYRLHDEHIADLLAAVRNHVEHANRGWEDDATALRAPSRAGA